MSIYLKYGLIILGSIFLILGILNWLVLDAVDFDSSLNENHYELDFDGNGKKVFIQARTWGLAGNHEEITVSSQSLKGKGDSDENGKLIFYTSQLFYKKVGEDVLELYVPSSSIQEQTVEEVSNLKIVVKGLDSAKEIEDYDKNYKKYGLSRVTVNKE